MDWHGQAAGHQAEAAAEQTAKPRLGEGAAGRPRKRPNQRFQSVGRMFKVSTALLRFSANGSEGLVNSRRQDNEWEDEMKKYEKWSKEKCLEGIDGNWKDAKESKSLQKTNISKPDEKCPLDSEPLLHGRHNAPKIRSR